MGDQEMQFADPAWRPSQQRGDAATPQPINHDEYEQVASILLMLLAIMRNLNKVRC